MEEIVNQLEQINQTLSSQSIDWTTILSILATGVISYAIATLSYKKSRRDERNKIAYNEILIPLYKCLNEDNDNNKKQIEALKDNANFYKLKNKIIFNINEFINYYTICRESTQAEYFFEIYGEMYHSVYNEMFMTADAFRWHKLSSAIKSAFVNQIKEGNSETIIKASHKQIFHFFANGKEHIPLEDVDYSKFPPETKIINSQKYKNFITRINKFDKLKQELITYIEEQAKK